MLSNVRVIRTEQAKAIKLQKGETFGAEFLIRAYKQGLRMTEILVDPSPRRKHPRIGNTITANFRILKALFRVLFIGALVRNLLQSVLSSKRRIHG